MRVIFLGTSSGVPTKQRNVSAIAVKKQSSKNWSLVDCGEGTQHQILRTKLSLTMLTDIYITHVHGDHTFGLPGLLASAAMAGRTEPLNIVGPKEVKVFVTTALSASDSNLTYPLHFIDVAEMDKDHRGEAFSVEPVALSHRVPSYAYVFEELNLEMRLNKEKLKSDGIESGPIWGQLQRGENVELDDGKHISAKDYLYCNREPRKIIVGGDNDTPELLSSVIKTANVLIHESTYTQEIADKVGPAPQHSSAAKVAKFAESSSVDHLILTHFSARYQDSSKNACSIQEVVDEAKRFYRGNLFIANDFDVFDLNSKGMLNKVD